MSDTMTPSQSIVAAAPTSVIHEITDSRGRILRWKLPTFLEQVRMIRAIGAEQSSNQVYVQMVTIACSIVSIDGAPQPKPTNEVQIDGIIERLGDEGVAAISAYMRRSAAERSAAEAAAVSNGVPADPLGASASS